MTINSLIDKMDEIQSGLDEITHVPSDVLDGFCTKLEDLRAELAEIQDEYGDEALDDDPYADEDDMDD